MENRMMPQLMPQIDDAEELLDADGRDADGNLHWDSADDAEQRDYAADDAEPQAESDDAADDASNAEPDGDDSQARDDSQATLHLMSPVPADDAELNGEPDDATDDAADDAELNGEPDDPTTSLNVLLMKPTYVLLSR